MKAYPFLLSLVIAVPSAASAQQIPRQSYQDSVIGWMKVYKFTGARAPMTVDAKRYSAELETKFAAGYQSGTKWYPATGFSNNESNNRITVSIRKSGESLQVFLDSSKIAEYEKAMPAAQVFNKMSFSVLGSPSEQNDKFYLSKIKISK